MNAIEYLIESYEEYLRDNISECIDCAAMAVSLGVDVNKRFGPDGDTMMHVACASGCDHLAQALMKSENIDLLARNAKGHIPLDTLYDGRLFHITVNLRDHVFEKYVRKYTFIQAKERGIEEEVVRRRTGSLDGIVPIWKPEVEESLAPPPEPF